MEFKNKTILLVSPEPWGHIFVSKHHYAVHLGKRGNKVFFLNPPSKTNSITATDYENVFSVNYNGFPKGMRFFPKFLQGIFVNIKFQQLQKWYGVRFDIIWSFDNSVFYDFSKLPDSVLKISHIVDLNQNFQFENASRTSTVNLSNTRTVLSKQLKGNPKSYFINHGFTMWTDENNQLNLGPSSGKVRVGYAGNLDIAYMDWKLLSELINRHKDICEFFFAGNLRNENRIAWFKSNSNLQYLGTLPSYKLHSFYSQMDMLLICYQADLYSEQLENTHKMMEYLGAGNVIVATKTLEYTNLANDSLIAMTNKNNEFIELFDQVLQNLNTWNSDDKKNSRINFALENTYDKQIERIENILTAL